VDQAISDQRKKYKHETKKALELYLRGYKWTDFEGKLWVDLPILLQNEIVEGASRATARAPVKCLSYKKFKFEIKIAPKKLPKGASGEGKSCRWDWGL